MSIDALRVLANLLRLCAKQETAKGSQFRLPRIIVVIHTEAPSSLVRSLTLNAKGCIGSIEHNKGDRRVLIKWDTTAEGGNGAGTAILELGPNNIRCQITDKNMTNNTCQCSNQPAT